MAKLNIEIDTENDKMVMVLNGSPIPNVRSINIYQSYEEKSEYYISIDTVEVAEDGMKTYTSHVMECEMEKEEMSMAKASIIPGFMVKSSVNQIQKDIQNWLKKG